MTRVALALLVALVACGNSVAPRPKVHTGLCTIVYTYWNDRADPSKGAITIRLRPENTNDCPDEVVVLWDEDR